MMGPNAPDSRSGPVGVRRFESGLSHLYKKISAMATTTKPRSKKQSSRLRGALIMFSGLILIATYVLGLLSPDWRFMALAVPISIVVLAILSFAVLVGFEMMRIK